MYINGGHKFRPIGHRRRARSMFDTVWQRAGCEHKQLMACYSVAIRAASSRVNHYIVFNHTARIYQCHRWLSTHFRMVRRAVAAPRDQL